MNISQFFSRLFKGRINRGSYICGLVLLSCPAIYIAAYGAVTVYRAIFNSEMNEVFINIVSILIYSISALYVFSFTLRRAHDIGIGWDVFLRYGLRDWLTKLQLFFKKGEPLSNEFGPSPDSGVHILKLLGIK